MHYHLLLPAYGAVYTTKREVIAAWKENKDFRNFETGRYMNRTDALKYLPGDSFQIRYGKNDEKVIILS